MPYHRDIRFSSALVGWHELRLLEAQADWGDEHQPATPRLVLPLSRWIECRIEGRALACDAISPLWLTPDSPYRLRQPWADQRSLVLVLHGELPGPVPRRPRLSAALQWQLARQAALIGAGQGDALALDELVGALTQDEGAAAARVTARARRAVERARQALAAQPEAQSGLSHIAHLAAASPFHLARCFRALTGRTLHGYRTRLRMAEALARLRGGEANLSALAADLGYSSHSHFTAVFRRSFATTPDAARTQLRRNSTAPRGA
jgi:AraC family transcriptional regulator